MRSARTGALALAASVLLLPAVLYAHGVLRKSEPANGAVLRSVPRVIRLTFTEPPQLAFTRVELIGPDSQVVALSPLRVAAPDSSSIVVADIHGPLTAGRYRIRWQITSADGHPVRGVVTFRIRTDAVGLATSPMDSAASAVLPPVAVDTSVAIEQTPEPAAFGTDSWPYAVIRLLTFTAILAILGAIVFSLIVVPAAHHRVPDLPDSFVGDAWHRAARTALIAAVALVPLLLGRLVAQAYALTGAPPDGQFLVEIGRTPWGAGFFLAAASIITLVLALRRPRRAAWRIAAFGGIGLALASSLSGHAAASGRWTVVAIFSDTIHIVAAAGWLGALLAVVVAGLPTVAAIAPLGRRAAVRGMLDVFSPMALTFAATLAVTGVIAATLRLGSWSALIDSDYGRVLLFKLGALTLVLASGAYNWLRLKPKLDGDQIGTLRRTATTELLLGFVVLLMTAWLVATPPPAQ